MTSTIIENYSSWVIRYIKSEKNCYAEEAQKLDKALKGMTSIGVIHDFLFNWRPQSYDLSFFSSKDPEDLYIKRVGGLKELVSQLNAYQQSHIIDSLDQLVVPDSMMGLMSLIKKTFAHPRVFLFSDSVTLSRQVMDLALLQRIIDYLVGLPIQQPPKDPKPGSFDAVKPFDDDHAFCQGLLRNNSAVYYKKLTQFREAPFTEANIFLQSLLSVYQATHAIKIEVVHPFEMEAAPPVERICPSCSIL